MLHKSLLWSSVTIFSLIVAGCGSSGDSDSSETSEPIESSSYTMAILPDTQKYARYSPERFDAQTEWIANNYAEENIVFTVHLGDVVDIAEDANEWAAARNSMSYLEGDNNTPYSILAGNHDILNSSTSDTDRVAANEPYLSHFGASHMAAISDTFQGTDDTGFNSYHTFTADGREYLLLAIDWRASAQSLAWVQTVLDANPDTPTILTTHQLLNEDSDGDAFFTDYGAYLWDQIIADNDQIFMTFNGHHHGESQMIAKNNFGRDVIMIMVDYQSDYWGGNGMMQLVTFIEEENKIEFRSFSPWVENMLEADRQPQDQLERWIFELDFDFASRFANLNNNTNTDNPNALVDGVVSYWVFDQNHALTNPSGEGDIMFSDLVTGGKTFVVEKAGEPTTDAQDHIQVVAEQPGVGSAAGYLHLDNSGGDGYYLSTNGLVLSETGALDAYTIEVITRIDQDWSASGNQWSGIFGHLPSETEVCDYAQIDCGGGDASILLATSSLKEFQWLSLPENGDFTASWSWEVMSDYWYHIVITNDGEKVQMYVDGSRVMRTGDALQPGTLSIPGGKWVIGSGSWEGNTDNLFKGDISELRISNRVLDQDEWLNN